MLLSETLLRLLLDWCQVTSAQLNYDCESYATLLVWAIFQTRIKNAALAIVASASDDSLVANKRPKAFIGYRKVEVCASK